MAVSPFDYCDQVASFYASVFKVGREADVRRRAFAELLSLGVRHSRYAVADIVREVLWEASSDEDVGLLVEVISQSPYSWWYRHWQTFSRPVDERVLRALGEAQEPR